MGDSLILIIHPENIFPCFSGCSIGFAQTEFPP